MGYNQKNFYKIITKFGSGFDMVSEISFEEFKKKFFKIYGVRFIDGFTLFQSPLNHVEYGDFKLYDNYADEEIYEEIPILKNLFSDNDEVFIYTDNSYQNNTISILKASEIKTFLENSPLDFFSNEPLFINFPKDTAFGYSLEGPELDSGMFYQLNLKNLRETNRKKLIKKLIDILATYCYTKK